MTGLLRILSIGAGYFARFHVQSWQAMEGVAVVGLADLDAAKAQALADDVAGGGHEIAISDDPVALMGRLEADIIDIAVPPDAHLPLIEAALGTRARAIICQKPFCGTLERAQRAVEMAEADGRPLIVHENFRFQPWYRRIKEEIASGRLGAIYQASFRLRPGDGQGPDAYLARQPYFQKMARLLVHETGVHWIDTFRFLFGEPEAVFADLRRLNPVIAGEDAGLLMMRYSHGMRTVLDGNRLVDHAAEDTRLTMGECLIEGSAGTLSLDGDGRIMWREHGGRTPRTLGHGDWPAGFGGGCVAALQKHVVAHLGRGAPLENTARDYLRVQIVEEAAYRSAAEGRWIAL